MGLFGNAEDKDAKREQKAAALMAKFHLEEVSPEYREQVKEISYDLMGNKLTELGAALQGNAHDTAILSYMSAIVRQNWIIIRLLDDIAKK